MNQQEKSKEQVSIYITANALINDSAQLESAIQSAKDAGVDGFELRRELWPSVIPSDQISPIRSQVAAFPAPPAYSIPRPIFSNGRLDRETLGNGLSEARSFGCSLVKFSPLGMVPGERDLFELRSFLEDQAGGLTVTVENDQSAASGDIDQWVNFFERAAAVQCPIQMTFDLGNWLCVDRDPVEAAQKLGRYVAYVHIKSVEQKDGKWSARPIRSAAALHPALAYLPLDVPRAIEFPPVATNGEDALTALRTYITYLRSGYFAL